MITSCKKEEDPVDNTLTPTITNDKASLVIQVTNSSGNSVAGAEVSINGLIETTDNQGLIYFNNISVASGDNTITTAASGYYTHHKVVHLADGDQFSANVELTAVASPKNFNGSTGGTINIPSGGSIVFNANSIEDANEVAYTSTVQVSAEYIDPYNFTNTNLIPNSFKGSDASNNTVFAENHGMLLVELSDGSGNELHISSGNTAEIHVPIPTQDQGSAPATIPLYHFNPSTSKWEEEGTATLVGNEYVGDVSHFSFWMCPYVYDHHFLSGSIECMGDLVQGTEVNLYNQWGAFIGSVTTNSAGGWSGSIPDVLTFTMEVEDHCGSVVYSNTIGPFSSNTNLGAIDVCNGTGATYGTVQGNLTDCNNNALSNSILRVQSSGVSRYLVSASGTYNHALLFCNGATQASLMGMTNDVQQVSVDTTMNIAPTMSFGTLHVCNSNTEFCTFELDGVLHYYVPNAQTTFQGVINSTNQYAELRVTVSQNMKFAITGFDTNTGSQMLDPSNGWGYTFDTGGNDNSTFLNLTLTSVGSSVGDAVEGYISDTTFYDSAGDPRVLTDCSFRINLTNVQ